MEDPWELEYGRFLLRVCYTRLKGGPGREIVSVGGDLGCRGRLVHERRLKGGMTKLLVQYPTAAVPNVV